MNTIYNTEDYYMYEILEDYQTAFTEEEQEEIFTSFCSLIWNNPNERNVLTKNITFHIKPELLSTELGQIFSQYSSIPRSVCSSITQNTDFASLIRQKVNNIYTNLFDAAVCTRKDYLELLQTPRRLYYQWEASIYPLQTPSLKTTSPTAISEAATDAKSTFSFSPEELADTLQTALYEAAFLKETYGKQKMKLSWQKYQQVVEGFFRKLFRNYTPLDDYQDNETLTIHAGTWHEDNFCISYFCNGLNGYFKNYQKKYYGLYNASSKRNIQYARCSCGNLFQQNKQHNRKLCDSCREQSRLEKYRRYNEKRKHSSCKPSSKMQTL